MPEKNEMYIDQQVGAHPVKTPDLYTHGSNDGYRTGPEEHDLYIEFPIGIYSTEYQFEI